MKNLTIKDISIKLNKSQYYKLQFISYCMNKNAKFDDSDPNILIQLIDNLYDQFKLNEENVLLEKI